MYRFWGKYICLSLLLYSPIALGECFQPIGIMGGGAIFNPASYAGLIGPNGTVLDLPRGINGTPNMGYINHVMINGSGYSIIGGQDYSETKAYAAQVLPSGNMINLNTGPGGLPSLGVVWGVAINASGFSIMGGADLSGLQPAYAALVSPSAQLTNLPTGPGALPTLNGAINVVAINDSNYGLIGGQQGSSTYAALVSPLGAVLNLQTGPNALPEGLIYSVAINPSGNCVIGGYDSTGTSPAYAALVSPSGAITNLPIGSTALPVTGKIYSVEMNALGNCIIGGSDDTTNSVKTPYAALVSSSGVVSNLPLASLPTTGYIGAVDINDAGTALIGGSDQTVSPRKPYAAFVSPSGSVTNIGPFPIYNVGVDIETVSINQFGVGLVGGGGFAYNGPVFAALVTPTGTLIPLSIPNNIVYIDGVSLIYALSQIPTQCLVSNNRAMAKYINKHAPEKAFYFLPALVDGTLNSALESTAPTRNTAALYTASNNLFMLNQGLSRHLREQRHFFHRRNRSSYSTAYNWEEKDQLSASVDWNCIDGYDEDEEEYDEYEDTIVDAHLPTSHVPIDNEPDTTLPPYALWSQGIGAFSFQKAEHQTPGFNPITGGLILGFEANLNPGGRVGGGAAYSFTDIEQQRDSGHTHIDQEYVFAYGFWSTHHFYLDAALWAGIVHTHQVRNIEMTGFQFRSTSDPRGWQLSPHLELGLDYNVCGRWLSLQPFLMFDWANYWQEHYAENGSGPFNMGQKEHYSSFLRSELGFRFFETVRLHSWCLVFQEMLSYLNKKPFGVGTMNAFFVGSPGSFTVETLSTPQNAVVTEFAMVFEPKNTTYPVGTVAYQGEWSEQYHSHQLSLEIFWNF